MYEVYITRRDYVFVCGGNALYADQAAAEFAADSWDPRLYRAFVVGPVTSTGDYAK